MRPPINKAGAGVVLTVALLVVSAVIYWLSFPDILMVQGASFLAWGCAFPLFWALEGKPWQLRLLLGVGWGFLSNGLLLGWLIPVSWAGWFVFTGALSIQGVLFFLFFPTSEGSVYLRLFLLPSVWVFSEWVRAIVLGGFVWSLGYSQASWPEFLQAASWGGVYALAWVVVFVNAAVFLGVRCMMVHRMRRRFFMAPALVLAFFLIAGALRIARFEAVDAVRVATIQPNIVPEEKIKDELYDVNVTRHMALAKKVTVAGNLGPEDIVVWPETAFTDDVLTDIKWRPRLEDAARNLNVHMLVGSALLWDGHDLNSAVMLSPSGVWLGVYHKMHLVPFTEKIPRGFRDFARVLGVGKYDFTAGTRPGIMRFGRHRLGVVICSEEFYPDMFRHLSQGGVDVAVVMLNDGWFKRPEALWLHALMAPVRAVESGLPVVRAANTGKTCAFDGVGRPLGRVPELNRPGVGFYRVPLSSGRTIYAQWGDIFALACSVFVIITFLVIHFRYVKLGLRNAVQ
ncbi:MAG: apolipoprotein N-acyltransferase [Candidatus Omnitrophota bacterium]